MTLKGRLNNILPTILSPDPDEAMTADEIIALVREHLSSFAVNSISATLSAMAKDPLSVVASREASHGYYLKVVATAAATPSALPTPSPTELRSLATWSADEIVVATEAYLRIVDGEPNGPVTEALCAELRRHPEEIKFQLHLIATIRGGIENHRQTHVDELIGILLRGPRSTVQHLAEVATSLWASLRDTDADLQPEDSADLGVPGPDDIRPSRASDLVRGRIGIHLVCRDHTGVKDLLSGQFESRAWRVAESTARDAEYLALHQRQRDRSYRQGRIIRYDRDLQRPNRFMFTCEPEPASLPWPGPISTAVTTIWRG
jgi:hypothetical protein